MSETVADRTRVLTASLLLTSPMIVRMRAVVPMRMIGPVHGSARDHDSGPGRHDHRRPEDRHRSRHENAS
jgi:hypothetical protein